LPQRGSRPHWIICGLEEPDKPDTPLPIVGGRQRQNRGSSAQCGMSGRCYLPSEARPRPSGVGPGSARPVTPAKSSFQFLALQRLHQILAESREPDRPPSAETHMVSAGVGRMRMSSIVERPVCLTCKHRMGLARISPGQRGFEERTFECRTCHRIEKISIAIDPLKTDAVGWLASELRPPR